MDVLALKGSAPNEAIESILQRGIKNLNPPQELAVKAGLLEGKSLVVASPTASGKTLIAELAIIRSVIARRRKAIYIAPMRALVSEKYDEFKASYPYLKIAMSIGDLDSLDPWLASYDIVLVSTEKLDSLIRHGASWLQNAGCIVFDEIHMLDDPSRGPTLEILITKLRRICDDTQMLALSATIANADELAGWLDAGLVSSDYRPIRIEKGIVLSGKTIYIDREEELEGSSEIPEIRIMEDVLSRNKQLLTFYSTKRNAEAGAERISRVVEGRLSEKEKKELREVSAKVLGALGRPTAQCEKLAKDIERGVAFHHGGLVNAQRRAVEDAFRNGTIKAICSTTTLGLGVNMPAHTVLVRDTSRYGEGSGAEKLSVNEVTQLFGRAGRPKYDTSGRALLIARGKAEIMDLYNRYIGAGLEPITSSLGVLPVLRSHVLAFVATGMLRSEESISAFFDETFYGHQYANARHIRGIVGEILEELMDWEFITRKGSIYTATRVGNRISELYIDPLTAKWLMDVLQRKRDEIANLYMISNTVEMRPYVRVTNEAEERFVFYKDMVSEISEELGREAYGYYYPLKPFSTALMLYDWMEEKSEPELMKKYYTTPGTLFAKISNADWMLYSAIELAKLTHMPSIDLVELRVRMRYGIKSELLDLVRLEQVGRVRARLMYNSGIRRIADLGSAEAQGTVERLFGKELSKKIIEQVGGEA